MFTVEVEVMVVVANLTLTAAKKTGLKLPILPYGLSLWDVCFSFDVF